MFENLQEFEQLNEEEKKAALKILQEISAKGSSITLNNYMYSDYDEVPVTIHDFMHNKKYLGNALYDPEGRFTVFPYWEKKLEEIFPTNTTTQYNTLIFTGAIGLGKSTIAVICLLYLLYRLLCLKDPYLYYGLQPIDKISISLINITIENAKGVALDKMNQMILASEWFLAHGEMRGTTNLEYVPNKHIEIIAASSNNQVIGRALFANFTDEVNFGLTNDVEKLKKKQKQLISQVDARMRSRFLRGTYLPTLNIIASSKNSDQSFLEDYINSKKKNESTTTLIVDEPQWVVDSRKDSPEHFFVAVGNKFLSNELLPKDAPPAMINAYRNKGYTMLEVPIGYYENFQDNIDGALTDIAGIATASSLKFISGPRWTEIKTNTYENPFIREIIEVGNAKDDLTQYSEFFDLTKVPLELKSRPLYIHLDMSKSGDKTGIAGVYITGKKPKVEGESSSKELFYKVAFNVSIKAPKGYEISFDKNRAFIRWLKAQGFAIRGISCFKGNTLINTPNGLIPIKDIKIGDIVYAYDDDKHKIVESKVYNQINNGPKTDFIKIWFTNTDYIECTPEHLIKTKRGYVMAKDILDNDLIEVDDALFYKQKLLCTGCFIDNEYLNKYIDLIINNINKQHSEYTEKHHIIPKAVFKYLNEFVDNSSLNIVKLKYSDHILAHYLISKCVIDELLYKMTGAAIRLLGNSNKLSEEEFINFISDESLQNKLTETKIKHNALLSAKMKNNQLTKGRAHTAEEKYKLSIANKKPHGVHPKTEFKNGHIPWNKNLSYDHLSAEEKQKKFGANKNKHWINNGKIECFILNDIKIPAGFKTGRLPVKQATKEKIASTLKEKGIKPPVISGYKYYTNGIETLRIFPSDSIPDGFYLGRTMNTEKTKSTNFLKTEKFLSIDPEEYKKFFYSHSRAETLQHFDISLNNHKKLCNFYNINKRRDIK